MTSDTARQILLDYRPGVTERTAEVEEALSLARQDADLGAWLTGQGKWHREARAQFRAIQPPPGLKQRILDGRKIIPLWRRPSFMLAAAAVLAGLLVLTALWLRPPGEAITFEAFRGRMVGFALREYRMDFLTDNRQEIRRQLGAKGAPADYVLPPGLETMRVMGGARLSWQDNPVSMVCFALNEREILYLFVMNETAVRNGGRPQSTARFAPVKQLMTASWSSGGNVYLLAGPVTEEQLKNFLRDGPIAAASNRLNTGNSGSARICWCAASAIGNPPIHSG